MFDVTEPTEDDAPEALDALLRHGLRELHVPAVSPDFDQRVLQAIQRPRPWWWIDWRREGLSLIVPGATAVFACVVTLGITLWTGAAGPVHFSPNRVVQNVIEATLQAADSGQVSATSLLLHSRRAGDKASLPAQSSAPPAAGSSKTEDKRKSRR